MPRQRRGPRPQGRAARQLASVCRQSASVNRLAPTPVPQRPRGFLKTAANRSVQERILSNAGPLSVRAGRKMVNPANFLPIMHRGGRRSRRRFAGSVLRLCSLMEPFINAALFTARARPQIPRQGALRSSARVGVRVFVSVLRTRLFRVPDQHAGARVIRISHRTQNKRWHPFLPPRRSEGKVSSPFFLRCGRPARA